MMHLFHSLYIVFRSARQLPHTQGSLSCVPLKHTHTTTTSTSTSVLMGVPLSSVRNTQTSKAHLFMHVFSLAIRSVQKTTTTTKSCLKSNLVRCPLLFVCFLFAYFCLLIQWPSGYSERIHLYLYCTCCLPVSC